jgi:hypothetical protein
MLPNIEFYGIIDIVKEDMNSCQRIILRMKLGIFTDI